MSSLKNFVNFAFSDQKINVIANLFDYSKNQQNRDRNICESNIYKLQILNRLNINIIFKSFSYSSEDFDDENV